MLWCWMDMQRNECLGAAYNRGEAKGQGTAPTPEPARNNSKDLVFRHEGFGSYDDPSTISG